jgi:hypothetical protein
LKIDKAEIVKWAGDVERTEVMTNSYGILVGKTEVIIQIERPKHRWDDDVERIVREKMEWIHLVHNRIQLGGGVLRAWQ